MKINWWGSCPMDFCVSRWRRIHHRMSQQRSFHLLLGHEIEEKKKVRLSLKDPSDLWYQLMTTLTQPHESRVESSAQTVQLCACHDINRSQLNFRTRNFVTLLWRERTRLVWANYRGALPIWKCEANWASGSQGHTPHLSTLPTFWHQS